MKGKKENEKISFSVSKKTLAIIAVIVIAIVVVFVVLPMAGINLFGYQFRSVEEVGRSITNISSDVKDVMGILEEIERGFK